MWHDIQQNNDDWLDLRIGKVTGSSISKVMAHHDSIDKKTKSHIIKFGDPAQKLAVNIAIERITGKRAKKDNYKNSHMDRGHEEEPIARMSYEDTFFVDVENGGFYDNHPTGCSPDGRVGNDGLIEIKSVIPTTQYATVKRANQDDKPCGYDPAYKWQYIFNLRESGRKWIDFVSYCSGYPEEKRLYVYRITREMVIKEFIQIKKRLVEFESFIKDITFEILNN